MNRIKRVQVATGILLGLFIVSSCGKPVPDTPTADVVATQVAEALTVIAAQTERVPTATPMPIATRTPTSTPVDSTTALEFAATMQGDSIQAGSMAMGMQIFAFDPESRLSGAPGGLKLTLEDAPPVVMYDASSLGTGSMYMDYADVILDLSGLSGMGKATLNIATQYTIDGDEQCRIQLNIVDLVKVFISPSYIVFPNTTRIAEHGGPFVTVRFRPTPEMKGSLVLTRNGDEIARLDIGDAANRTFPMEKTSNENDVIKWWLEDEAGTSMSQGTFGFPMSGAQPGLVEYLVDIVGDSE